MRPALTLSTVADSLMNRVLAGKPPFESATVPKLPPAASIANPDVLPEDRNAVSSMNEALPTIPASDSPR